MTKPDWAALRMAVRDQLNATGSTPGEVATRAGLSRETVRPIINGVPGNYRPATMAKVSLALGWTGDSIQRVLDGEQPQRVGATMGDRLNAVEAEVVEIRRILDRVVQGIEGREP